MNGANLVRRNGALVNTDKSAYEAAKQRRLASQMQSKEKARANTLEQRVLALEKKVQMILEKINEQSTT